MKYAVRYAAVLMSGLLLVGCREQPRLDRSPPAADRTPTPMPSAAIALPPAREPGRFVRLPTSWTGVDVTHYADPSHPNSRLYHSGFICGGIAVGDIDGDDRPDLLLVGAAGPNRLFKNLGDCRFQDITDAAGIVDDGNWGAGATMVDIDNDGDLDIYVCNYDAPNTLYINQADGRFVESAARWHLDVVDANLMPAFCDYDRDGDLDVYLLTNRYYRQGGRPSAPPWRFRDGLPYLADEFQKYYSLQKVGTNNYTIEEYGRPDRFLRNNGDGTFSEVTDQVGIAGHGFGLSATWWDYDADGWPDIYVCNDFNDPDRLYRNNGDGTFTDVLLETMPHTPWFSMGSDAGDINNDGRVDFFVVDMAATNHYKQKTTMGAMNADKLRQVAGPPPQYMRNALYLNTGTSRFMEIAYLAGVANTDWSWAAKLADLDNDGWLDVFVSNGMIRSFNDSDVPFDTSMLIGRTYWDLYRHLPSRPEQNLAFRNTGDLRFEDASHQWGLDLVSMSYGTALADLDGDQDLDLIVVNVHDPIAVYRNDVSTDRALTVKLRGSISNRDGLGARLKLETERGQQVRFLNPVTGFLSSNEPLVHFGVASGDQPVRLTVTWPSGIEQQVETLSLGKLMTVHEPGQGESPTARPSTPSSDPLFRPTERLAAFVHRERPFDDFQRQPLLPNRLSQLGPGLAMADVDGDGDDEIYLGGAAGQGGQLLINRGNGQFDASPQTAFDADSRHEDMGCLFFDVDADGDEDLYVVSGGVEAATDATQMQDRLYLNDGQGLFARAPFEMLPTIAASGSTVNAADFDRDGDLDIYVGGRVIPGEYPLAAHSYLLRNDNGRLVDVTTQLAAGLERSGLVTAALWSDVDDDGWCDLWVVHEWGPVALWHNQQGRLVNRTELTGLARYIGWWNGIAGRDLDGDGDMDFVVTNFGLNTKYHASATAPALLYYGEFANAGQPQLIEAEFEDDKLFPIRGRSCSTQAMPFLRDKYTSYHDFALAKLTDLYTERRLSESHRFAATTLESGVLLNQGGLRFEFHPLPVLAQASPAFGVVVSEMNGDTAPDIYMVNNFFGPQPETGRMDGGLSLMLHGRGDGRFDPHWPVQSGLVVAADAKSLILADTDHDGLQEIIVGVNDAAPLCFVRAAPRDRALITIRLTGSVGNPHAVGARVTVHLGSGASQMAEVQAGGGYLSQSPPVLVFGAPHATAVEFISVRWPDGTTSIVPGRGTTNYQIATIPPTSPDRAAGY
jgi:hypothetical protein